MNILRRKFIENFNMERIAIYLMDLIEDIDMTCQVLDNFIYENFNEEFMYGEIYDIFKDEMSKEELKILLEDMGHDFVDLDELDEEEKAKYMDKKKSIYNWYHSLNEFIKKLET